MGSWPRNVPNAKHYPGFESKSPSLPSVAFLWAALAAEQASQFAAAPSFGRIKISDGLLAVG